MELRYDKPASHDKEGKFEHLEYCPGSGSHLLAENLDDDWERWSLPLGNGYFGVNVFGRTESERITVADKTLANSYGSTWNSLGGLNTFTETYLDFGHAEGEVRDYLRTLDLECATATVSYTVENVHYTREFFTSYPGKVLAILLKSSEIGKLNFTLRPTIPYRQDKAFNKTYIGGQDNNTASKTGRVTASVTGRVGEIELSGTMGLYGVDYLGLFRVFSDGEIRAGHVTTTHPLSDGTVASDVDGTLTVTGGTSALVLLTLGTNYELTPEVFLASSPAEQPTHARTPEDVRRKVTGYLDAVLSKISGLSPEEAYDKLRADHLADYRALYGRVTLDLDFDRDDTRMTTDALLSAYREGRESRYLEALYFQYGRYLLIASSRAGALPAHLQGTWNHTNYTSWSAGYWHNINVQMNYWPAFSTNLSETFQSYVDYNAAYLVRAKQNADAEVRAHSPELDGRDGGNGWVIGTGGKPYSIESDRSAGNLGFTTALFWDYYAFTKNKKVLGTVYPLLTDAARYITKCVVEDGEGHALVAHCDSPEQHVGGVWYYTSGTTYAQTFAYLNNKNTLRAAEAAGTGEHAGRDREILSRIRGQIDKYDPIVVGYSGQIKEFREETYYGDLGEKQHRHISHLVGLYPGDLINADTPAWIDAAKLTLTERGDRATGWGVAHRLNLWARTGDGERAHDLLRQILRVNTATNLWDLHPPFQIDGNLGATAGIAEMLLQSHEGYLSPLAALPAAWKCGAYTGLCARGNFTVDLAWRDGVVTTMRLTSGAGERAEIRLSGVAHVTVTDSEGLAVVTHRTASDRIAFDTVAGESYLLTGFERVEKLPTPAALTAERVGSSVTLRFDPVAGAASYQIVKAVGSAPTYTPVGTTNTTTFIYNIPEAETSERITLAVLACGADGSEGRRALAYLVPQTDTDPQ